MHFCKLRAVAARVKVSPLKKFLLYWFQYENCWIPGRCLAFAGWPHRPRPADPPVADPGDPGSDPGRRRRADVGRHRHHRRRFQPRTVPALHQPRRSLRRGLRSRGRAAPSTATRPVGRGAPLSSRIELLVSDRSELFEEWLPVWHFAERVRSRRAGGRPGRRPAAQAAARAPCRLVRDRARQSRSRLRAISCSIRSISLSGSTAG